MIFMILTVGFDSFLEKIYHLNKWNQFETNQVKDCAYNLGGKSINVAMALKDLNLDIFTTGFLGGLNGKYIFSGLKELDIYNDFIHIKDETPANISVFKDKDFLFKLREPSPRITREELGKFYQIYENIVYRYEFICALGEIPLELPRDIYFNLIKIAKEHKRKLILDTSGEELSRGIEAIPFMLKLKLEDLEKLSKIKINFESEIIKLASTYIEKGIKIIVIDLDEKGSIVLTEDLGYRVEISNNECKLKEDNGYMVCGYTFGLKKRYDIETIIKLGQSMRIVYNDNDTNLIDMSDIKRKMKDIEIRKINY